MKVNFKNITIFDSFPAFNCFDASIYSIVLNLGSDPRYILLNEYNLIKKDDNNIMFSRSLNMTYESVMNNIGFEYNEIFEKYNDIIKILLCGIELGYVYMIHLYEPISYDVKQKKRNYNYKRFHWLVIYGYDDNKKIFLTMDYLDVNTFVFKPMIMTYSDLLESYSKTISENQPYLISVKKNKISKISDYGDISEFVNIFLKNIKYMKKEINELNKYIKYEHKNGIVMFSYIKNIILFNNYLKKIRYIFDKEIFNDDFYILISNLIESINGVIGYSVKLFQTNNEYLDIVSHLLDKSENIIRQLVKSNYKKL